MINRDFEIQIERGIKDKLNVCFLLKHNIGDCRVHLDWFDHVDQSETCLHQKLFRQKAEKPATE